MRKVALIIFVLLAARPARATVSVSPAALSTGLSWDNMATGQFNYQGTPIGVSGVLCTPSAPCTWTIKDQNGLAITSLSTSGGVTPGAIVTSSVSAGGSNYAVNDTGLVNGNVGGVAATYSVKSVSAGAVVSYSLSLRAPFGGFGMYEYVGGYSTGVASTTTTTGSGAGFQINITKVGWPQATQTPAPAALVFGQIDCTGSANNTSCVYNAPAEWPSGEKATITVSDGSTSADVTVNFAFTFGLQEYFKHLARQMGVQSKPVSNLITGSNPQRYQPELLIFQRDAAGNEAQFLTTDGSVQGPGFPKTAGSMVNRPAWTYNGRWFSWMDGFCPPGAFCNINGSTYRVAQTDGTNLFTLSPGTPNTLLPNGANYTYTTDMPNWIITSDTSNIYVADLAQSNPALVPVASYNASLMRRIFSPATGPYAGFRDNIASSCSPISPSCSPNYYLYDLTGCESSLAPGCASIATSFNAYIGINTGWYTQGYPHCSAAGSTADNPGLTFTASPTGATSYMYDVIWYDASGNALTSSACTAAIVCTVSAASALDATHTVQISAPSVTNAARLDFYRLTPAGSGRTVGKIGSLAGASGSLTDNGIVADGHWAPATSQCEWHMHDNFLRRNSTHWNLNFGPAGSTGEYITFEMDQNGQNVSALYPNASKNRGYWSHPAWNWSGDLEEFSGTQACAAPTYAPTQVCTQPGSTGEGYWDTRTDSLLAFQSFGTSCYAHAAWDGYDNNLVGHDGGSNSFCNMSHFYLWYSTPEYGFSGTPGSVTDALLFDFGVRNYDAGATHSFSLFYSPTQSPDGNKLAEPYPISGSQAVPFLGWIGVVHTPYPPVGLSLTSSSSATLGWLAHPLNHETMSYGVYKQANCSGSWSRLAYINAVYLQTSPYTYTDVSLASGSNTCYGISSLEWDGIESNYLSNAIKLTNSSGVYSSQKVAGAGTIGFDSTAPGPPSSIAANLVSLSLPNKVYTATQVAGGSLADGTYWLKHAYCNYADFPVMTLGNIQCTPASATFSKVVSGGGGTAALNLTGALNDAFGQMAVQIYACGPSASECSETLQTTIFLSPAPSTHVGEYLYQLTSISPGGAVPPASNQTLQGYKLTWSAPCDSDVRYYAIYSRDDAAPVLLNRTAYDAQQYPIATFPANQAPLQYLDYTPNWYRLYGSLGGPHYGIVAVDHLGNRSTPVCFDAHAGGTEACN